MTAEVGSSIPWIQRRQRGRFKAFFQTLWLVLMRPAKLAQETEQPARVRAARGFCRINLVVATIIGAGIVGLLFGNEFIGIYQRGREWTIPEWAERNLLPAYVLADT